MKITIEIEMGNSSFDDSHELDRVLQQAATRISHIGHETANDFKLFDSNGNRVGFCKITEE